MNTNRISAAFTDRHHRPHRILIDIDFDTDAPRSLRINHEHGTELRDRLHAALSNSGLNEYLSGSWIVRPAAATVKPSMDLAVAQAILTIAQHGHVDPVETVLPLAELGLDSSLRPLAHVHELIAACAGTDITTVIVAEENVPEALGAGVNVVTAANLADLHHGRTQVYQPHPIASTSAGELYQRITRHIGKPYTHGDQLTEWLRRAEADANHWISLSHYGWAKQRLRHVRISGLWVPKLPPTLRGRGRGDAIMRAVCALADANGWLLCANPEDHMTGFLGRHGFVHNRGSDHDRDVATSMYRHRQR